MYGWWRVLLVILSRQSYLKRTHRSLVIGVQSIVHCARYAGEMPVVQCRNGVTLFVEYVQFTLFGKAVREDLYFTGRIAYDKRDAEHVT